jgi:hypothetical protein
LLTFFFVPAFFPVVRFFVTVFFLVARFLVTAFFLVTLRLLAAFLRAGAFFADTFRRVAETFFRFLLAAFFAGIVDSCRLEKRRGLYIACPRMEAHSEPVFAGIFARRWPAREPRACGAMRIVLFWKFL